MKISSFFITVAALAMLVWLWNSPQQAQPHQPISPQSSQPSAPKGVDSSSIPPAPFPPSASSFSSLPPARAQESRNSNLAQNAGAAPSPAVKKEASRPPRQPLPQQMQSVSSSTPSAPRSPLPDTTADSAVSFSVSPDAEAETETIELPADLPLPVALVVPSSSSPLPPPVAAKQEEIAQAFLEEVLSNSAETEEGDAEISDDSWRAAKASADHLFKILYGDAAYNQRSIQAVQKVQ